MVWTIAMRKVKAGLLAIPLSTLAVFIYFYKQIDIGPIWMILLVFAIAIMTYGLAAAFFAEYVSSKISSGKLAFLTRFILHVLFGLVLIGGEFMVFYSLGASLIFFFVDEILRAKGETLRKLD
ncbi:hypothetical protein [Bacillus sp. FJAT-27445]|uniref:hypothetical protein n=1 Tax=Bacillus sp. FJAT-27445 TaxID=1679166 RepID=UPI000A3E5818|nr:hypothetical protein [Bacillus sp. FJAT-27445]